MKPKPGSSQGIEDPFTQEDLEEEGLLVKEEPEDLNALATASQVATTAQIQTEAGYGLSVQASPTGVTLVFHENNVCFKASDPQTPIPFVEFLT